MWFIDCTAQGIADKTWKLDPYDINEKLYLYIDSFNWAEEEEEIDRVALSFGGGACGGGGGGAGSGGGSKKAKKVKTPVEAKVAECRRLVTSAFAVEASVREVPFSAESGPTYCEITSVCVCVLSSLFCSVAVPLNRL